MKYEKIEPAKFRDLEPGTCIKHGPQFHDATVEGYLYLPDNVPVLKVQSSEGVSMRLKGPVWIAKKGGRPEIDIKLELLHEEILAQKKEIERLKKANTSIMSALKIMKSLIHR